jgi:two-component system cell cycle response regulator
MRKGDKTTRILVAEDDPVILRLLQACLVEWGYKVTSVRDGQRALQVLQGREAPRLAILNWIMPGMNGIDICREIRKQTRKHYTYILLSTAMVKKQDVVEGLQSGADDYLIRPYNPHELHARLRAGRRILDLWEQLLSAHHLIEAQLTVDPLTGVWSRNVILDILKRQLTLSFQSDSPMSLMIAHVDHFRDINASFGPLAGDTVLREVGRRFRDRKSVV